MNNPSFMIVTNNSKVRELGYPLVEVEGDILQVLNTALDLSLQGHRLLSHPLSGSVKPSVNPYKSIIFSRTPQNIEYREIEIVQISMEKIMNLRKQPNYFTWSEAVEMDLKFLDFELVKSGIQSLAYVS